MNLSKFFSDIKLWIQLILPFEWNFWKKKFSTLLNTFLHFIVIQKNLGNLKMNLISRIKPDFRSSALDRKNSILRFVNCVWWNFVSFWANDKVFQWYDVINQFGASLPLCFEPPDTTWNTVNCFCKLYQQLVLTQVFTILYFVRICVL